MAAGEEDPGRRVRWWFAARGPRHRASHDRRGWRGWPESARRPRWTFPWARPP